MRYTSTHIADEFTTLEQIENELVEKSFSGFDRKEKLLNLLTKLRGSRFVHKKKEVLIMLLKTSKGKKKEFFSNQPMNSAMEDDPVRLKSQSQQMTSAFHSSEQSKNKEGGQLFRDILSVYQGIDSNNIVYSRKYDMYILSKESKMQCSTSAQKMLSSLCEIGWLFRVLSLHLNKLSKRSGSLTVQSFAMAVRDQLNEYYRHIMMLDMHYFRVYIGQSRFFLTRLKKFNMVIENKMKTLAELVDSVLPLEPHQILNYLYTISRNSLPQEQFSLTRLAQLAKILENPSANHKGFGRRGPSTNMGATKAVFSVSDIQNKVNSPLMIFNSVGIDPSIEDGQRNIDPKFKDLAGLEKSEQDFLLDIFRKSCKSLVEFVNTWVFRGEILDPNGEFFVRVNSSLPNSDQFWSHGMFFLRNMVPGFLNASDAEMIFKTGKIQRLFKKLEQGGNFRGGRDLLITDRHYSPAKKTLFWDRIQSHLDGQSGGAFGERNRIEIDEMISANSSKALNSKLAIYFAYSNSLLMHHFFVDRQGLLVFQFVKMTFLLTRGDFAAAFLESLDSQIGFENIKNSMKHQILLCLEQAISVSIQEYVENGSSDDFRDLLQEKTPKVGKVISKLKTVDAVIMEESSKSDNKPPEHSNINEEIKETENQIKEEKTVQKPKEFVIAERRVIPLWDDFRPANKAEVLQIHRSKQIKLEKNYYEKFLLCENLGIRFFEKSPIFSTHFLNFSLHLPDFEFPLNNVFSKSLLRNYSLIFQYLFSLKIIQYRLRKLWLENSKIMRGGQTAKMSRLYLMINAFQGKMRSFVDGLLDFYLVDVITVRYSLFCKSLGEVIDFEELIRLHHKFVYDILEKLSLDYDNNYTKERRSNIQSALVHILRSFEEYCKVQSFVTRHLTENIQMEVESDDSMTEDQRLETANSNDKIIDDTLTHVFKLERTFSTAVAQFTLFLQDKEFEIRNDFNEYYARDTRSFKGRN